MANVIKISQWQRTKSLQNTRLSKDTSIKNAVTKMRLSKIKNRHKSAEMLIQCFFKFSSSFFATLYNNSRPNAVANGGGTALPT